MSYCTNCGAYIPDGETKCVSCGADAFIMQSSQPSSAAFAQEAQAKAEAAAAASEDLRKTLEEKQREQQEKTKEWAETAYADRKAHQAHTTSGNTGGTPSARVKPDGNSKSKLLAGLSYLSILWILPFFFTPKSDDFARFHAKQGAILFVAGALIDLVGELSGLVGLVLWLGRLYLIFKGIKNVVDGKMEYLPWIGQFAEKF